MKGITTAIFNILAETVSNLNIVFSRKSFYQKSLMLEFGFKPWQINQTLKGFERREYLTNKNGGLYLTKKGRIKINCYKLEKIKLSLKTKWDGRWRLIIFDIPESIREVRDALRNKLREWNSYKIQNSVFVSPFSCEKEMEKVCSILEAHSWIHIFSVDNLGLIEEKVKKYYRL